MVFTRMKTVDTCHLSIPRHHLTKYFRVIADEKTDERFFSVQYHFFRANPLQRTLHQYVIACNYKKLLPTQFPRLQ